LGARLHSLRLKPYDEYHVCTVHYEGRTEHNWRVWRYLAGTDHTSREQKVEPDTGHRCVASESAPYATIKIQERAYLLMLRSASKDSRYCYHIKHTIEIISGNLPWISPGTTICFLVICDRVHFGSTSGRHLAQQDRQLDFQNIKGSAAFIVALDLKK
jgi:hypothetical protein